MQGVRRKRASREGVRWICGSTLNLPRRGAFHLYSVLTRQRLAHWYAERGTVDANVRFAFACPDLKATHLYLREKGVRTSEIAPGPGGREFFDFYAPEGTRLTAVGYPEHAAEYPNARFTGFAPWRAGVSDLARAVAWYQEVLGLSVEQDDPAAGSVLLSAYLWLEQIPPERQVGPVDGPARPYLICRSRRQFVRLHQRLAEAGARPSPFMGLPGHGWTAFHFYDPDGNRLNVWSYF